MSRSKTSPNLSASNSSLSSSTSSKHNSSSKDIKRKVKDLFHRHQSGTETSVSEVVVCKRSNKFPILFLAKRRQMRKLTMENPDHSDDNTCVMSTSPAAPSLAFEEEAQTFAEYTQHLEEALTILRDLKRDEYESEITLKILRFLENLIHQPKEWISGAKLKLCEMKFPELAMTLMNCYKEKGYLVRRKVFVYSILLYNSMSNFTDHEFDKEGLIRRQSAAAGFIEFACDILNDPSYHESLKKSYTIRTPEDTIRSDDFNNYQKILYICDSALTILYNLANLPELKVHFREYNAITIIVEYTKLPSNTIRIQFPEINENEEHITSIKELRDIASAIRVTSCLLLPLIMNEDEDNLLAANTSGVLQFLSNMIQKYNQNDQRFYGFSFIELVDGLSKLMVRGRKHTFIDENLVNRLLHIMENSSQENSLLECVSSAILNAAFDENVRQFLNSAHALNIIRSTQQNTQSQLVQKNCEAILWTLNRITHKHSDAISSACQLQGHIMISYNRSVMAMCLKIRDRLKSLRYNVWLDVDDINGGVLESMAQAVENSSIVLICMNEQYKQSYYCRLEAEYATELRKACIPCLMQPRFRPYGWLGIIKGAKMHVDFATLPFDEAFALLMREIETIRGTALTKDTNGHNPPPRIEGTSNENNDPENEDSPRGPVTDWNVDIVKQWLERCGLSHLSNIFQNIDGQLLDQLSQMKQLSADSYYKFLDKHFDRLQTNQMSDLLKFDYELRSLFSS